MGNKFMLVHLSERKKWEARYNASRYNLLLVIAFTVINLILLIAGTDLYFLFSAFIPFFLTDMGMVMSGRYPEEFYTDGLEDLILFGDGFLIAMVIISVVLTGIYLLAYFLSKKNRVGWIIFALVFFGIDTVGMLILGGISLGTIIDILFHAWVIYYLIVGIVAHFKLKKLPIEEAANSLYEEVFRHTDIGMTNVDTAPPTDISNTPEASESSSSPNTAEEKAPTSLIIRHADKNIKHRVLAKAHMFNYDICYRRVKHTNELVINGNVYDELEGLMEYPHTLKAWIDGHYIAAGYTGTHSFISVDGEKIVKKLRVW